MKLNRPNRILALNQAGLCACQSCQRPLVCSQGFQSHSSCCISFDALREDAFTSSKPLVLTCASGIGWEYHVFTAFAVSISASLWALCLDNQVTEDPLFKVPTFLEPYAPRGLLDLLQKPPKSLKRLQQLVSWVQGSMVDQYLDLSFGCFWHQYFDVCHVARSPKEVDA